MLWESWPPHRHTCPIWCFPRPTLFFIEIPSSDSVHVGTSVLEVSISWHTKGHGSTPSPAGQPPRMPTPEEGGVRPGVASSSPLPIPTQMMLRAHGCHRTQLPGQGMKQSHSRRQLPQRSLAAPQNHVHGKEEWTQSQPGSQGGHRNQQKRGKDTGDNHEAAVKVKPHAQGLASNLPPTLKTSEDTVLGEGEVY